MELLTTSIFCVATAVLMKIFRKVVNSENMNTTAYKNIKKRERGKDGKVREERRGKKRVLTIEAESMIIPTKENLHRCS